MHTCVEGADHHHVDLTGLQAGVADRFAAGFDNQRFECVIGAFAEGSVPPTQDQWGVAVRHRFFLSHGRRPRVRRAVIGSAACSVSGSLWPNARDYRGSSRMAPSRRIVSPFNIALVTMWPTSAANSSGCPSRLGCGVFPPRASFTWGGRPAIMGVRKIPGATVTTRIRWRANSLAAGRVRPITPALDEP